MRNLLLLPLLLSCLLSCTEYTPKPRGYFRIEPAEAEYATFTADTLPYSFLLSRQALATPPSGSSAPGWINLVYPQWGATIYCSYLPVTPATLPEAEKESRSLVQRLLAPGVQVTEIAYSNPEGAVYGSLFLLSGETSSPAQFMLTDSLSRFFRGALYFDCRPNADSLAPVIDYLRQDVIELMQSFNWKK